MKEFKSNEYKLFIKDIKELKSAKLTTSAEIGKFVKIAETKEHAIYVYEHESHSSFSSMTFTKVASLTEVEENKNLLIDCTEHAHHDQFLPFFCGNGQLKEKLLAILRHDKDLVRKQMVQKLMHDEVIFGVSEDCCNYDEDMWTQRLCRCFQHIGIKHKYTSKLRGPKTASEAMKGRIPEGVGINCFVFRGAPDIIIETPNEDTSGVLAIRDISIEDSKEEASDSDSDGSDGSVGSGRIQIGFQMSKMKPYKANSFTPVKCGEVVGAIHMALVAKALHYYKAGVFKDTYIGHGLFLHKVTGVIHIKVVLSDKPMKVKCVRIVDGTLNVDLMCTTMKYFMGQLLSV